jgi:hypothetical protein
LDTEAQRRELEGYQTQKRVHKHKDSSPSVDGLDSEEQRAILADIKAMKVKHANQKAKKQAKKAKRTHRKSKSKKNSRRSQSIRSTALPKADVDCFVGDVFSPKKPAPVKGTEAKAKEAHAPDALAQIAPESSLGTMFKKMNKLNKRSNKKSSGGRTNPDPSDSSSSSSSSSDSRSDSSSSSDGGSESSASSDDKDPSSGSSNSLTTSTSSSESSPSSSSDAESLSSSSSSSSSSSLSSEDRHQQRQRRRRHGRSRKSKSRKERIKPIEPRTYNGTADPTVYSRFMQEMLDYSKSGNVGKKRHLFVASHYLSGRAYKFYEQKYSRYPSKHNIRTFFRDLFKYCFPADYRSKLCERLYQCTQGNRRVRDYVHELHELFTLLGDETELNKVVHLWEGL